MKKCNECGNENADNFRYCSGCGYELIEETHPIQKSIRKGNWEKSKKIIIGSIAFLVAYFLVQQLFFKTPNFDKILMEIASDLNESCPMMIDSDIRGDNVVALRPKIFQYNYTFINMEKDEYDFISLKNDMEPIMINSVRTNPNMKFFRDNKVTLKYYYKDKNGNYLFTISVTPEQYE